MRGVCPAFRGLGAERLSGFGLEAITRPIQYTPDSAMSTTHFHVISMPKKCMNTCRVGRFFGFICGLRM
jgi:hypothetical protein